MSSPNQQHLNGLNHDCRLCMVFQRCSLCSGRPQWDLKYYKIQQRRSCEIRSSWRCHLGRCSKLQLCGSNPDTISHQNDATFLGDDGKTYWRMVLTAPNGGTFIHSFIVANSCLRRSSLPRG